MSNLNKHTVTTNQTVRGNEAVSTTGMSESSVKTTNTVQSVARDAQAQIDAQVAEALAKSRALNAQDHAKLQSSIGSATASLEEQARVLKMQIDEEKRRAEAEVLRTQQEKLSNTAARQQLEEKAILEAAAARKLELEQKSMRLQQEIEEITRRKTAEMMAEKPGNLQFVHEHQDTSVTAQLAGDIGHALDIKKGGHITETTTGGEVQYHPVKVQEVQTTGVQQARATEQTIATQETHERKGGILHAMKSIITGQKDEPVSSTHTSTTGVNKAAPGTRAYDEQSTWAAQSDKHVATK
jgi:hypothetical protein